MPLPTEFPGYDTLPDELKFLIVGQAAAELTNNLGHSHGGTGSPHGIPLAKYACIDCVWQETIERATFDRLIIKCDDIEDFGKICGKRHGFLHHITLSPYPPDLYSLVGPYISGLEGAGIGALVNHILKTSLQSLFNIMTDWSCEERRRPELVKLVLDLNILRLPFVLEQPISIDFSGLPTVNVIGSFSETENSLMDASTGISIYKKLPNLNQVFLNFLWQPTDASFVQEAMGALDSLKRLSSVPRELSIVSTNFQSTVRIRRTCQAELPLLRCLSRPSPQWSDTITSLHISCIKDVPQFIHKSQMTSWPQLRTLHLEGGFQTEVRATNTEAGEMVIQSLIGALSKMPKVDTINTNIWPFEGLNGVDVDLHIVPGPEIPDSLPFVPAANKGITVIRWASIPGQSAARLQDAVWSHYGRDSEVFCIPGRKYNGDDDDDDDWGALSTAPLYRCKRWNRQKNQWDRFTSALLEPVWKRNWVLVEDSDNPETGDP